MELIIIGVLLLLAGTIVVLSYEIGERNDLIRRLHEANRALREQSYDLTITLKKLKKAIPKKKQVKHKRRLK